MLQSTERNSAASSEFAPPRAIAAAQLAPAQVGVLLLQMSKVASLTPSPGTRPPAASRPRRGTRHRRSALRELRFLHRSSSFIRGPRQAGFLYFRLPAFFGETSLIAASVSFCRTAAYRSTAETNGHALNVRRRDRLGGCCTSTGARRRRDRINAPYTRCDARDSTRSDELVPKRFAVGLSADRQRPPDRNLAPSNC